MWYRVRSLFFYYFPFTWSGSFLFFTGLLLLGIAWGSSNTYALLFSLLGLAWLFLSLILAVLTKLRNEDFPVSIDTSSLYSRQENQCIRVVAGEVFFPFPLRLHYVIRGKFKAGRKADFFLYFEGTGKEQSFCIPVFFPVCGTVRANGYLFVKDLLHLIKVPLRKPEPLQFPVLPSGHREKEPFRFVSATTFKTARKLISSDEEKYLMREYIPGDRMKDINWKTSIRIQQLVTRYAPSSPEESKILYVEIRPYHYKKDKDGIKSLMQLNYMKSWAVSFLTGILASYPDWKIDVFTGKERIFIENKEDMETFMKALAELEFMPYGKDKVQHNYGEKYIFTTGFDIWINKEIEVSRQPLYVFRVVEGKEQKINVFPYPGLNLLPGLWIFRREVSERKTVKPRKGKLIEEAIDVGFI